MIYAEYLYFKNQQYIADIMLSIFINTLSIFRQLVLNIWNILEV